MTDWLAASHFPLLEPVLDAALELAPEDRDAFVLRMTETNPALRLELNALLRYAARMADLPLLDQSASAVFSSLLRDDADVGVRVLESALAGRYAMIRPLGAGGMATVYLAIDLRVDRQVAIKVLRPDLSRTVGAERFAREVQVVATLDHPNIVGALDSGEAEGHFWLVMPFIDGESLRQRLVRDGARPLDEALSIAHQVADALGYAHRRGVMHRDIKPDNILLSNGHAFVADFGIARAIQSNAHALTNTGMSVGTPAYMAPEQAAGSKDLDERVDVYALGSVLYEMLAGTPAFTGPNRMAIMVRAQHTDPRPIHPVRAAVTPALDAVILKAMSRTPTERYATMSAFRDAIAAASTIPCPRPS
ncbi:MAG: serine/threonine protein kinase [Gemmatimonadetes bacterium]|nr:serine/threonine protein kinase [Gemmatimonadota bacterium]